MDDLKKMELSSSEPETNSSTPSREISRYSKMRLPKKKVRIFLAVLAIFIILLIPFFVLPAIATYRSVLKTKAEAQLTYNSLKQQNIEQASTYLDLTKKDLEDTQQNLSRISYTRFIPLVGGYYNDADHLLNAGSEGLAAGRILIDSVKPYADILGLKGKGSFTQGSAEQRIQTAVMTMGKITPRIDDIANDLVKARKEIDQVDPNHYPSLFGGDKIKKQLVSAQTLTDQGVSFVDQARPLIKVLPTLLGESHEKKYLVLFQNDKELRPTGGFITAYAIFRIDKGIINIDKSEDIYTLDDTISDKPQAPAPILNYLPKVYALNLRDSNLSPDFIESMKTFYSLYQKASGKTDVNGIIALDTHVLVSTIKILDDKIDAAGMTFTTKQDQRCGCPQVIYELENSISRPVNYVKTGRKDLLGALLYAIMQKALKSSPKIYWGPLFQDVISKTNEKHVLFDVFDTQAQNGIEALNAAGRIKSFDGDYLHINEANFGGAKSNLYVTETVNQDITIADDQTVKKTVTINYKNPFPPSNCDLEAGGLCLNAVLRDWVRVYVSSGSKLLETKGSQVKVRTYDELGKTVFEGFLTVNPLGIAKYSVTYELPFKLKNGSPLPLLIQKQPGVDNFTYTVNVNGSLKKTFNLDTDKKLLLSK